MRTAGRALIVWVVIMTLESAQGILRTWLLAPRVGDFEHARSGYLQDRR